MLNSSFTMNIRLQPADVFGWHIRAKSGYNELLFCNSLLDVKLQILNSVQFFQLKLIFSHTSSPSPTICENSYFTHLKSTSDHLHFLPPAQALPNYLLMQGFHFTTLKYLSLTH